mgnify:CR=1 FL=1
MTLRNLAFILIVDLVAYFWPRLLPIALQTATSVGTLSEYRRLMTLYIVMFLVSFQLFDKYSGVTLRVSEPHQDIGCQSLS